MLQGEKKHIVAVAKQKRGKQPPPPQLASSTIRDTSLRCARGFTRPAVIPRNLTMACDSRFARLLHDRDSRFGAASGEILHPVGIQPLALPPRGPNLIAHLERWNRSVNEECLAELIFQPACAPPRVGAPRPTPSRAEECAADEQRDPIP
jgi:hypothetical protein